MSLDTVHILLVEDNEADIVMTCEAFVDAKLRNEIAIARDGYEAMEYLRREGQFVDAVRPDIILLDLNLPGPSGKDILKFVKSEAELKDIPVVILTSSEASYEVKEAYTHAANCYIVKPVDMAKFIEIVRVIENFWVQVVKLPA